VSFESSLFPFLTLPLSYLPVVAQEQFISMVFSVYVKRKHFCSHWRALFLSTKEKRVEMPARRFLGNRKK
jgi:hypothetical protein